MERVARMRHRKREYEPDNGPSGRIGDGDRRYVWFGTIDEDDDEEEVEDDDDKWPPPPPPPPLCS